MSGQDRTCPACENDKIVSLREANAVFRVNKWNINETRLEEADRVCSFCKIARINGEWTRLQTVRSRASELASMSNTKSRADYRKKLTSGPQG